MNQLAKHRKILVTSALPYANGPIHIGHLVEYIQTDIWVRFQRMQQNEIYYVGADDAHGTPIMIKAKSENLSPEELIKDIGKQHKRDFDTFLISFDNYYSTHSEENQTFCENIYQIAIQKNMIVKRTIEQAFDTEQGLFLPDRLIKGTCPRCNSENQYGDNCEVCGATYNPTDLINPKSTISGSVPELRQSEHLFFDLPQLEDFLKEWTHSYQRLQKETANKLDEWFEAGLKQWDISRDAPYFGFAIPNTNNKKYFYVWVDAPVGYMASFKNYCDANNVDFNEFWHADSEAELHHFIGKDIVYFHTLFWPAMLKTANYRLPTKIHVHGFLTVNGKKMSKSRGTLIRAETWAKHLPTEPLRYFFASRLSARIDDLDLNLDEFRQKFNTDIVGKVVNISSRCSGFLNSLFDNTLCPLNEEGQNLIDSVLAQKQVIADKYEATDYNQVIRDTCIIADQINAYIHDKAPWKIAKSLSDLPEIKKQQELHSILSTALQGFACLIIYLKPILPNIAKDSEHFMNLPPLTWQNLQSNPLKPNHQLKDFVPLAQRLQAADIENMIKAEKTN